MTRRYAFVGLGNRAQMYVDALLGDWSDTGEITALCDLNQTRMDYYNQLITAAGRQAVPTFTPDAFDALLERADVVVVTTMDSTHAHYVCTALDAGRDVVVEKPLTIDAESCERIADAAERNPGQLIVTFNYRYSPVTRRYGRPSRTAGSAMSPPCTSSGRWTPSTARTTSAAGTAASTSRAGCWCTSPPTTST